MSHMKVLGVYSIESVIQVLQTSKKAHIYLNNTKIKKTKKINLFLKNRVCVICGREGNAFVVLKTPNSAPFMELYCGWNLKSKPEQCRKLTIDHIFPRSLGGSDSFSNFQVMCSHCNSIKGSLIISNDHLKNVVKYWNSSLKKVDRKARIKEYLLKNNIIHHL